MKTKSGLKVFIQEDNKTLQKKIAAEFKEYNCVIKFFSKSESAFELLNFNPDILIQDFTTQKAVKCYKWSEPYNHWQ